MVNRRSGFVVSNGDVETKRTPVLHWVALGIIVFYVVGWVIRSQFDDLRRENHATQSRQDALVRQLNEQARDEKIRQRQRESERFVREYFR